MPVDFSGPSERALDYAVRFADQFGAKLLLLHVVEPLAGPELATVLPLLLDHDKVVADCKARLELLVKQKAIAPRKIERTLVREGRSYHEIAAAARSLKVDMIILSTHGYTGIKRAVLGSTTERVVRHAPCTVLVVRENERESAK